MLKVAHCSCIRRVGVTHGLFHIINREPDVILLQGDMPYVGDSASNYRGITTTQAVYNSTQAQIFAHHQQTWSDKGFRAVTDWRDENHKVYGMLDDHELGGDNWDYSITQANTSPGIGGSSGGIPSQAEVYAHAAVCIAAWQQMAAIYLDNPANTDSGVAAELPLSAAGSPTLANFPPLYFRAGHYFDGTPAPTGASGDVEIFTLSCIVHKSPLGTADVYGTKGMLGPTQLAWLKARLLASTATWKIISSTKKTYKYNTGDNGDTFAFYTAERDNLLAYIKSNNIKGVVWLTGDWHVPSVIGTYISRGATYDHADICACPIGTDPLNGGSGSANEIITQFPNRRCYGWSEFDEDEARFYLYNAQNNRVFWRNTMIPSSNAFVRRT